MKYCYPIKCPKILLRILNPSENSHMMKMYSLYCNKYSISRYNFAHCCIFDECKVNNFLYVWIEARFRNGKFIGYCERNILSSARIFLCHVIMKRNIQKPLSIGWIHIPSLKCDVFECRLLKKKFCLKRNCWWFRLNQSEIHFFIYF